MTTGAESPPNYVFLLECSLCGAKITQSGIVVGGNESCAHKYGPCVPIKESTIVYPTDAERKWLRILDENKKENEKHNDKFKEDAEELNKLKSAGLQSISLVMKKLRDALDNRQDELEKDLVKAFDERQTKIYENMQILRDHRIQNEEAKSNAETLLRSDEVESEREKVIVSKCENIINTTPNMKYIDTELKYKFDELETIQRKIACFGILRTMPIGSGKRCIFKSIDNATNSPHYSSPKAVKLPSIGLDNSSFDEEKERVKVGFKMNEETMSKDVDILQNLYIVVRCSKAVNIAEQKENDDQKAIFEETIAFKHLIDGKYEFYVNYKFPAGMTVAYKLKAKFLSPDKQKWTSAEGEWSREGTQKIPEEPVPVVFNIELNGKLKQMSFENDGAMELKDFDGFKRAFLSWFGKELTENEKLVLTTKDGLYALSEKSSLISYATDSYVIKGQIEESFAKPHSYRPQLIEEDELVPNGGPGNDNNNDKNDDVNMDIEEPAEPIVEVVVPKQISCLVHYSKKTKRVLLRNNEEQHVYEYTMDALQAQMIKKFKSKKLKLPFKIATDKGQAIRTDEDIAAHLFAFKGDLIVTK